MKKINFKSVIILALGLGLVIFGLFNSRVVYTQEALEYGVDYYDEIKELHIIEDTTFDGIVKKDGKLYSTYDRSAKQGKRACPT